jgi:hypothetical protein
MANLKQRQKKREKKAAEAAKASAENAKKAAQAKGVAPCPDKTPQEKEAERIAKKYTDIAANGHTVQRHGEAITEQQLKDRAVNGFDPATGTTDDAYNKNPDGSPREHNYGRHATKFESKEALVKVDEAIRKSQTYKDELKEAIKQNASVFAVKDKKLEDALGKDYKKMVSGVTREGSKNNPTGNTTATDFTDGTIRAVYKKDASGNWNIETMFPEPK